MVRVPFISVDWPAGRLEMSRVAVLRGAVDLLMDVSAPGDSEQERAAWRACVKRGLRKMQADAEEIEAKAACVMGEIDRPA